MRSINELLILMSKQEKMFYSGLCSIVSSLYGNNQITYTEHCLLHEYIELHRPKWYQRHYNFNQRDTGFYWAPYMWTPRLKWLKTQIRKTK